MFNFKRVALKHKLESIRQADLKIGQLGFIENHGMTLCVYLGLNNLNNTACFYQLGPVKTNSYSPDDEPYINEEYLNYFMPLMVEFTLSHKLDETYWFTNRGYYNAFYYNSSMPVIDIETWYQKNRLLNSKFPQLEKTLTIWTMPNVKPKDLVVGKLYARKYSTDCYGIFCYKGKVDDDYVLIRYDGKGTLNMEQIVRFKQAPTNCVELDDMLVQHIAAPQYVISDALQERYV